MAIGLTETILKDGKTIALLEIGCKKSIDELKEVILEGKEEIKPYEDHLAHKIRSLQNLNKRYKNSSCIPRIIKHVEHYAMINLNSLPGNICCGLFE
jgi:hypothetical protein